MGRLRLFPPVEDFSEIQRARIQASQTISHTRQVEQEDNNEDDDDDDTETSSDDDTPPPDHMCGCSDSKQKRKKREKNKKMCSENRLGCPIQPTKSSNIPTNRLFTTRKAMGTNACYIPMLKPNYVCFMVHKLAILGKRQQNYCLFHLRWNKEAYRQRDSEGNTPLMLACAARPISMKVIRQLVKNGSEDDINMINNDGLTALHFATLNNEQPLVSFLLESGADVNAGSVDVNGELCGLTPLLLSVISFSCSKSPCFDVLMEHNPVLTVSLVEASNPQHSLNFRTECDCGACKSRNYLMTADIVPPSKIKSLDPSEWRKVGTVLYLAARWDSDKSVVNNLLERLQEHNLCDTALSTVCKASGLTPLCVAVDFANFDAMEAILEKSPSLVNIPVNPVYAGTNNSTALHILMSKQRNFKDEITCVTCSEHFIFSDNFINTLVDLLMDCEDINIHAINDAGETPLMLAAKHGHEYACQRLVDAGADPLAIDLQENSALSLALELDLAQRVTVFNSLLKTGLGHNLFSCHYEDTPLKSIFAKRDTIVLQMFHDAGAVSSFNVLAMLEAAEEVSEFKDAAEAEQMDTFIAKLISLNNPMKLRDICARYLSAVVGTDTPSKRRDSLSSLTYDVDHEESSQDEEMKEATWNVLKHLFSQLNLV